ncbi:uncharacterized protein LOC131996009 [Stomoxys calcitrans]|uniref:uncharacterized protein LOC131996009 n=1 Tax=Stomoxys calcitrans TaxID=35570 RepID=UPI0027E37A1B|nr:uncharacterized protein LOC131996009 [Stomoxys calcitrans]
MACIRQIFLFANIVAFHLVTMQAKSSFKFTNINCSDQDIKFSHFEICRLKVIGRGVVSLNIKAELYKTPVTNSTIIMALYKKSNGFQPYLYNYTIDVCAFFENRKRYPVVKMIFAYNDAIVVKDLVLNEDMFRFLPLPAAEYVFKMKVFAYNDLKSTVEVRFHRQDSLMP